MIFIERITSLTHLMMLWDIAIVHVSLHILWVLSPKKRKKIALMTHHAISHHFFAMCTVFSVAPFFKDTPMIYVAASSLRNIFSR